MGKRQSLKHMTPAEKAAHKREQKRLNKRNQRGSARTERGRPMKLLDGIEGIEAVRDFPLADFVDEIAAAPLSDAVLLCDMRRKQKGEMPNWDVLPEPENPTERFCPELFELGFRPWSTLTTEDRARMRELQKQLDDTPEYQAATKEYREGHAAWRAARERRANFDRADGLAQILKPLERRAAQKRQKRHLEKEAAEANALGISVDEYKRRKRAKRAPKRREEQYIFAKGILEKRVEDATAAALKENAIF